MRITNNTLTGNYLRNLSRNLKVMQKYQNQLSSGKVVSTPSDNPMLVSKIMDLQNTVRENVQFKANIEDAIGWVKTADGTLSEVSATLLRARELVIYGANGTLSDTDRLALKDEVNNLSEQLTQLLNTNFDGRYMFGGQKTMEPPFRMVNGAIAYEGDAHNLYREIAPKVGVQLQSDGSLITRAEGTSTPEHAELGRLLAAVDEALTEGDTQTLSTDLLRDLDVHVDNVIRFRSKMGATHNRLEAALSRNQAEHLTMTELLSKSEDVDLAEKMMEYSMMSAVYQASLATGAKILQPSLLDYLR